MKKAIPPGPAPPPDQPEEPDAVVRLSDNIRERSGTVAATARATAKISKAERFIAIPVQRFGLRQFFFN